MGWAAQKFFKFAANRGWVDPKAAFGERPGDAADVWYMGGAIVASATGLPINSDMAMRASAVYASISILSKSIAALPLTIRRTKADGSSVDAPNHPIYDLLKDQPNPWQTSFEFRQMMQAHLALRGNAYANIVPGSRGAVDMLLPMHPDRVKPLKLPNDRVGYDVMTPKGLVRMTQDEVFHVRWLSMDGVRGVAPIDYMREPIGLALASQEYAARFFSNNATPGGLLKHPKALSPQARKHIKESWQEAHAGVQNAHVVALLEEGLEYQPIAMTNEQAQFIEARKFSIGDIARIWGIPPHLIGDLDRATFNNIEQMAKEFVDFTLRPWLVAWSQAIKRDLILAPQFFAYFDTDELVKPDFKSRMEGYQVGINNHILTPDEARLKEGMNPTGDETGSKFYMPANIQPADMPRPVPVVPQQPKPEQPEQMDQKALAALVKSAVAEEFETLRAKIFGLNGHVTQPVTVADEDHGEVN